MNWKIPFGLTIMILVGVIIFSIPKKPPETELDRIIKERFSDLISFIVIMNNKMIGIAKKNVTFGMFLSSELEPNRTTPDIACYNLTSHVLKELGYVSAKLPQLIRYSDVNISPNITPPYIEAYSKYEIGENGTLLDFQKIEIWYSSHSPYYVLTYWNNTTTSDFFIILDEATLNNILLRMKNLEERCKVMAIYCNMTYFACKDIPF